MKEIDNIVGNKTWKYLVPCLKAYGAEFKKNFDPLLKSGAFIYDNTFKGSDKIKGRVLFLCIHKNYKPFYYEGFMTFIRKQEYYVTEYCPEDDLENSVYQMVIISIPLTFHKAYDHFLRGEYSKMYSKDQVKDLFPGPLRASVREVLLKTPGNAFANFMNRLKKIYFAPDDPNPNNKRDYEHMEWDFPLIKSEEILNANVLGSDIFFKPERDKTWKT